MHRGKHEIKEALKEGRVLLITVFVFSLFVNLLMLTSPIFMLAIFDRVMSSRSQETLIAIFMLVVALITLRGFLDYSRKRLMARFGAQYQESLEKFVIDDSVVANKEGRKTTTLSDLDNVRSFFNSYALMSIFDLIWVPVFIAVVFVFHSLLGWVATIGVAILVLLTVLKLTLTKDQSDRQSSAKKKVSKQTDVIKSFKDVIHSHGMTNTAKNRWLSARNNSRDRAIEHNDSLVGYTVVASHFRAIIQTGILAVGAHLVLKGEITIGAMIASNFLLFRVFSPVEQFLKQWPRIRRTVKHWNSLSKAFESAKSNYSFVKKVSGLNKSHMELRDVSVDSPYADAGRLENISLSLLPGQRINIVGESGSGKTILSRAMIGAIPASSGTIRLGDTNIDQCSSDLVMRIIGYFPQQARFVPGTIKENITKMSRKVDRKKIISTAEIAKAHGIIERLPKGYQTLIDETASSLAYGERQRLSLARALYGTPKLLILDTPDDDILRILNEKVVSRLQCSLIVFSRKKLNGYNFDEQYLLEDGQLTPMDYDSYDPVVLMKSTR